jgi:hypothetical protein
MTIRFKAALTAVVFAIMLLALPRPSPAEFLEDIPGMAALHWATAVTTLRSGGVITVPAHAKILTGTDDLQTYSELLDGYFDQHTEAELRFTRFGTVEYNYCNCGYTLADDWQCVKPDEVAAAIRRTYAQLGWGEVVGFARPPAFDRSHATITYMLHLRHAALPNAFEGHAIILGRSGYESLNAGAKSGNAADTWSLVQNAIAAFHFGPGGAYDDYRTGDRLSEDHIAAIFARKVGADELFHRYAYASCRHKAAW